VEGSQISPLRTVRGQIQNGRQCFGSSVQMRLILVPNNVDKHLKCLFQLNLGLPIHLVTHLRTSELTDMQLGQGQGQNTLKSEILVKRRLHLDIIRIIINKINRIHPWE
jgi:hypothetical protein